MAFWNITLDIVGALIAGELYRFLYIGYRVIREELANRSDR